MSKNYAKEAASNFYREKIDLAIAESERKEARDSSLAQRAKEEKCH